VQAIEVRLPDDLPLVRADAKLVEQALGNVVGNAVTHTRPETLILIDAKVTDKAVALRVTDDGPGINSEMLPRMFDKFVHAANSETGNADGGEGTGLGLAIAKGIMDAHGGAIAAESPAANGHGTRIIFTFPREEMPR
jgi:two-component system sensor histidine kinase KdpD